MGGLISLPVQQPSFAKLIIVLPTAVKPPKFLSSLIQANIHMTAAIGTDVVEILAINENHFSLSDNQESDEEVVEYAIVSGNVGNAISIESDQGISNQNRPGRSLKWRLV